MMHIRYPNLKGSSEEQRARELESYLRYLVDQLNYLITMINKGG